MPQCRAIKADGSRCMTSVKPGVEWCYNHDPARAEDRRRNASRAGRSRPNHEIASLKSQLQGVADGVLDGSTDPKRGAVAVQALSAMIRAIEQQRRIREQEEILERLDQLEEQERQRQAYGSTGGRSWG